MIEIKNKKNKIITIILIVFLTAGLAVAFYYLKNNEPPATPSTALEEPINYSPPTDEERQAANDQKEKNIKDGQTTTDPQTDGSGKIKVNPVISYSGQDPENGNVEANGFVAEVYEEGGTCTLTLSKDGSTVSSSSKAIKDATTTTCGLITLERQKLSSGTWKATLSYSSQKATGTSSSINLEVK